MEPSGKIPKTYDKKNVIKDYTRFKGLPSNNTVESYMELSTKV